MGLLAASLVGAIQRRPVLFWSLELSFSREFRNPVRRLLKGLEKRCSRSALFTIVQDAYRARALAQENGIPLECMILVPNSAMGPPRAVRSRFFHRRCALPVCKRVVLHAGVIHPAALSLEVAQSASCWPEEWVLVCHERRKRSRDEPYIRQVEAAGNGKVFLSLDPVPYDRLDEVMTGAEIGLVFYREDLGPNFSCIAGASGKLSHYLRCGLPVICSALPGLTELMAEYRCGVAVKDPSEIGAAIQRIAEDYEHFSANAVRCYHERYEFRRFFRRVLDEMERHVGLQEALPVSAFSEMASRQRGRA